jgi:DNA-binding MarR family transcriptional regulator
MTKPVPKPSAPPLQPERESRFAYWFARIGRKLSQHLLLHMEANFGVNLAEHRILVTLANLDSTSIRDIAADAFLDKGQVTRAVADLTKRGLVIQVVDGRDRRLRVVTLTPAGQALVASTLPFLAARQRRLEQRLTAEERSVVWKALAVLSEEAESMLKAEARGTRRRRRAENQ